MKTLIPRTIPLPLMFILLLLVFTGCLPRASGGALESAEAKATQDAANIAFHRMEIGKLQSGDYNTNVLSDLVLPQGTQWTLLSFGEGSYSLQFTSDKVTDYVWLVSPVGVQIKPVGN